MKILQGVKYGEHLVILLIVNISSPPYIVCMHTMHIAERLCKSIYPYVRLKINLLPWLLPHTIRTYKIIF